MPATTSLASPPSSGRCVPSAVHVVCFNDSRSQEAFSSSYLLAWIPENLLTEKGPDEWDKFIKTEERPVEEDDDDDGMSPSGVLAYPSLTSPPSLIDAVLIDMPTSRAESYAFSVPLSSIYSLIVQQPSLSSWCEQRSFYPRTRTPH